MMNLLGTDSMYQIAVMESYHLHRLVSWSRIGEPTMNLKGGGYQQFETQTLYVLKRR